MISLKETIEEMDNQGEKLKLIMDMQSLPEGLQLDQFYNIIKNSGIVVWDSTQGGIEPKIIFEKELHLMDVGFLSKEQFNEKFENIIED